MRDKKLRELLALRAKHGLTQTQVAAKLGMSPSTYSQKEQGYSPFTVPEVQKILKMFDVKFEDIFLPCNYGNSVVGVKEIPGTQGCGFEVEIEEG